MHKINIAVMNVINKADTNRSLNRKQTKSCISSWTIMYVQ